MRKPSRRGRKRREVEWQGGKWVELNFALYCDPKEEEEEVEGDEGGRDETEVGVVSYLSPQIKTREN